MTPQLTPRHLFGDGAVPGEFTGTGFLERAAYEHRRGNTARQELALGGYLVARLVDARLDRHAPDVRKTLQSQVDACAQYLEKLPPNATETQHLAAILQEAGAPSPDLSRLELRLMIYAQFLEYHGRLHEALQILALGMQFLADEAAPHDRIVYALLAGKLNRLMTRWETAYRCYDAAEHGGITIGSESLRLRGLGGKGAIARGQGNLVEARRIAEGGVHDIVWQPRIAPVTRNLIYAELGAVYNMQGLRQEAMEARQTALRFATTPTDRMQALGECGLGRLDTGEYEQARVILEFVCHGRTDIRLRLNAAIELMSLESQVGDREAFERYHTVTAAYVHRMQPSMLVDFHFNRGMGLSRFGEHYRSEEHLFLGLTLAQQHSLKHWSRRIALALRLNTPEPHSPAEESDPENGS